MYTLAQVEHSTRTVCAYVCVCVCARARARVRARDMRTFVHMCTPTKFAAMHTFERTHPRIYPCSCGRNGNAANSCRHCCRQQWQQCPPLLSRTLDIAADSNAGAAQHWCRPNAAMDAGLLLPLLTLRTADNTLACRGAAKNCFSARAHPQTC